MLKSLNIFATLAFLSACASSFVLAALTPEEIAKLGKELTPMGAEKAGNADGTIPAWDGGITKPPAGYTAGMHHPDPYLDDQILYTITAANMDQYADQLSEGHKAMLKAYDTFKIHVYPTHRSFSSPQRIYDATKEVAATAELVDNGYGVSGAVIGIPFPIPKNGVEVIWNHLLRYRGDTAERTIGQVAPTRNGNYTMVKLVEDTNFLYSHEGMTEETLNNRILFFKQTVTEPARLAGSILLVHETLNQVKEHRKAWLYNPGQRRVRRAPNVAYDNPGTASDGQRTSDQLDMFNGATDRYNWKLVGKKEILVPYNSYKLHSDKLTYDQIIKPLHINPDLCRYELHRVWVVDATLKDGARHIYKRRTFYVDEDSWSILLVDQYDNRDEMWRVSEGHPINYYEVPCLWTTLEVHYDLQSGRYLAQGLDNEEKMYDFNISRSFEDYTPGELRREGVR